MAKNLVIVESPTKAKTLKKYLGNQYTVKASKGHVRDLPKSQLGVDTEGEFTPTYEVPTDAKKTVSELKSAVKGSEEVYLATDYDREGEAIAWHVAEAIGIDPATANRVTFTEITKSAILEAFESPRRIDMALVDAQQARRVLDRLVGYKLSPILWKKVRRGLSAGRVQSVAVRLIVDREREIEAFVPVEYWSIDVDLSTGDGETESENFIASLLQLNGKKLEIDNGEDAARHREALESASYSVDEVRQKERKRNPAPPFTTSTLQQEASRKLGFSSRKTMRLAQQLYEGIDIGDEGQVGLITYMRTDSVNVADSALAELAEVVKARYGADYTLGEPRRFRTKSKSAQEAHEAIRPTDAARDPDSVRSHLDNDQYRLYRLIWQRTVASQMAQARFNQTSVDVGATGGYLLRATGQTVIFEGFMRVYTEGRDDSADDDREKFLPELVEGAALKLMGINPEQHFTQPPPRFTEATLVKTLEENGIGRPSTYAPTISTIVDRGYVRLEEKRFFPEDVGMVVTDLLTEHFPDIVDVGFTARMEGDLDEIAEEKKQWVPVLRDFYDPFERLLEKKEHEIERPVEETDEICDKCGGKMVIKLGRYGKFLSCSNYPDCKNAKPIGGPAPEPELIDEPCPECGKPLARKVGRFGPFVGCSGYPDCKYIKKTVEKIGISCPECNEGELVVKGSRRGKFYGCDRYPECKFAVWAKPFKKPCPSCGAAVVTPYRKRARCAKCHEMYDLDEFEASGMVGDDATAGASGSPENPGNESTESEEVKV